jgi:hypothetical protein
MQTLPRPSNELQNLLVEGQLLLAQAAELRLLAQAQVRQLLAQAEVLGKGGLVLS